MSGHLHELCQVCKETEKKYQCPKCEIKYCSLVCFKDHKAGEEEESATSLCDLRVNQERDLEKTKADTKAKAKLSSMIYADEERDHKLTPDQLEKLRESKDLLGALGNPHLRNFLTHVDTTHSPKGFMNLAMQEPLFVEFADACLKALHPEEAEPEEMSLEEVHQMVTESIQKDIDEA